MKINTKFSPLAAVLLSALAALSLTAQPPAKRASSPQAAAGTDPFAAATLNTLSAALRQDLERGSPKLATLHSFELQLAILANRAAASGAGQAAGSDQEMTALRENFVKCTSIPDSEGILPDDPAATASLVDPVAKVQAFLDDGKLSDAEVALRGVQASLAKINGQQLNAKIEQDTRDGSDFSTYIRMTNQLLRASHSGDIAAAEVLAPEVLLRGQAFRFAALGAPGEETFQRNVFRAYDALGKAAFQRGDMEGAQKYLLLSGSTKGDLVLKENGPGLWLANALLKRGYQETVIQFLTMCKDFWKAPKIETWFFEIQDGKRPDFGLNARPGW